MFTKPRQRLNRMSDQSRIHYKSIIPHAINSESLPPTSRLLQAVDERPFSPSKTHPNTRRRGELFTFRPNLHLSGALVINITSSPIRGKDSNFNHGTSRKTTSPTYKLVVLGRQKLLTSLYLLRRKCIMSAPRCSPVPSTHAFHHFRFLSNGTCHESSVHCRLI